MQIYIKAEDKVSYSNTSRRTVTNFYYILKRNFFRIQLLHPARLKKKVLFKFLINKQNIFATLQCKYTLNASYTLNSVALIGQFYTRYRILVQFTIAYHS